MTTTHLTSAGHCGHCGANETSLNEDGSLYCHQCWRTTPGPETCGWLIQRPSNHPEPDFPEDLYVISECGEPVPIGEDGEPSGRYALCTYHEEAMLLPEAEFDRISDLHAGRAWS